jgi:hypothetical protein
MVSRLRNVWVFLQAELRRADALSYALLTVIVLGIYLRINGWLLRDISFWFDEAAWARRLLSRSLLDLGIRPIGFMWVTKTLTQTFGATEFWFRCLPALGGIGSMLLLPYVLSRLVPTRLLQVLLLLLFAIQPALMVYANEFKPYSLEVFIHLVPIALYLRYDETRRALWLLALLGSLVLGFLFAYNLAFAFPGVLLLCLYRAWRSPDRKRLLISTLVGGMLCACLAAGVYWLTLRTVTKEGETEDYWGKKYGVFYLPESEESRVDWTFEKYGDVAAFVGLRREQWAESGKIAPAKARELRSVDRGFWIFVSFCGLFALMKRRRELLLVLFLPLLLVVFANFVGKWPMGAFRTNLFTMAYSVPLLGLGLQELASSSRWRLGAVASLVTALTLIPAFRFGFKWDGDKRTFSRNHYQREILDKLYVYRQQQLAENPGATPIPLFLETHTYTPYIYYLENHPVYRKKYGEFFAKHFDAKKDNGSVLVRRMTNRLNEAPHGMWLVASAKIPAIHRAAKRSRSIKIQEEMNGDHLILFLKKKKR